MVAFTPSLASFEGCLLKRLHFMARVLVVLPRSRISGGGRGGGGGCGDDDGGDTMVVIVVMMVRC